MPNHYYFMELALTEAKKARSSFEVPIGAVLVGPHGEVLGRAHNAPISLNDPTAHAEVLALRQGCRALGNYRLPNTILYVTLEPCVMCLGAMLQARIRMLVFGAPDPKSGAAGSVVDLTKVPGFNHYIEVVGGIRPDESAELLKRFFQELRQNVRQDDSGEVPKWS